MRRRLRCRILSAITMFVAAVSMSACSTAPGIDGGIVGTGNRVDCEGQARKDRIPGPVPQDCERSSRQ
jgi:hypothetical protein